MVVGTMKRRRKRRNWKQIQRKIERGRGEDSGRLRQRERERQPDREVVSVYQEHTALAASSLSVVVPSSSLLQHLPERHQAEQDPDPSTAPSQDQSPINCLLLQAQLSSSALPAPYLSVSTPNHSFFPAFFPIHFPLSIHSHSPPALSPFKVLSLSLLGLERGRSHSISPSVSQEPEIPARDAI
ncbi:hypothetical protein D5F01_LYC22138 [Larimichthys crocea]|uniref:Uncharacterized protein n=1 Tax=Larimichthys crocea TaxID=215358 RepID=A0A6G0HLP3_LARCR|nr:hypothetical protein D5F01_LYC22138 [Larimichthys crocea]